MGDKDLSLVQKINESVTTTTHYSKANQPWLLDYKMSISYTSSIKNEHWINIVILAEQMSDIRRRILTFQMRENVNTNLHFNYFQSQKSITPLRKVKIVKCTDYNAQLRLINLDMDNIKDVMYGGIVNKNDNSSKSRAGSKTYPILAPKTSFKILISNSNTNEKKWYHINIYLTTWDQHFRDISWDLTSTF